MKAVILAEGFNSRAPETAPTKPKPMIESGILLADGWCLQ